MKKCDRCNGSGEIGRRARGQRETPGPVPEDARGWYAFDCPDCGGVGTIGSPLDDNDDKEEE